MTVGNVTTVEVQKPKFKIDFDPSKCWWCLECELACSLYHEGERNRSLARLHIELENEDIWMNRKDT
ncbi:hypothetical protein J7L06_03875 [Candidatus Bathyarchaeota archaeon]|nr:hypothetical protein [Candidatus Bathyarchaeota archaeon]